LRSPSFRAGRTPARRSPRSRRRGSGSPHSEHTIAGVKARRQWEWTKGIGRPSSGPAQRVAPSISRCVADPATGYWGAWCRVGDRLYRTTDLNITFHLISYLQGDVPHWPQIIETTFNIANEPYPYGWRYGLSSNNHNRRAAFPRS
jgi:hypothetical protein